MAANVIDAKDYQYEDKDVVLIRNAVHEIRESERSALQVGFLSYIGSYGIVWKKTFMPRGVKHFAGLMTGVIAYNAWLHTPKANYERIAGDLNYKTSIYFNKVLN
mmetsp:Transcript_25209/g.29296  ORF Transcript_25209/g.29296 Transcript_25209/m.29296 type:complete len:105 (+) Transcript_25209:48-362(+)